VIGTGLDLWEEIDEALKENAREPEERHEVLPSAGGVRLRPS
jgi:hypothetical protein